MRLINPPQSLKSLGLHEGSHHRSPPAPHFQSRSAEKKKRTRNKTNKKNQTLTNYLCFLWRLVFIIIFVDHFLNTVLLEERREPELKRARKKPKIDKLPFIIFVTTIGLKKDKK